MAAQILKTSTNVKATAALQEDGSVVVGGDKKFGGDPSSVHAQLTDGVRHIYSTQGAFAAVK